MSATTLKNSERYPGLRREFVHPCDCGADCGGGKVRLESGKFFTFCLHSTGSRQSLLRVVPVGPRETLVLNALLGFMGRGKNICRTYESVLIARTRFRSATTIQAAKRTLKTMGLLDYQRRTAHGAIIDCEYAVNFRRLLQLWLHHGELPPVDPSWSPFVGQVVQLPVAAKGRGKTLGSRTSERRESTEHLDLRDQASGHEQEAHEADDKSTGGETSREAVSEVADATEVISASAETAEQAQGIEAAEVVEAEETSEPAALRAEEASVTVRAEESEAAVRLAEKTSEGGGESGAGDEATLPAALVWTIWMVVRADVYASEPRRQAPAQVLETLARTAQQMARRASASLGEAGAPAGERDVAVLQRHALEAVFRAYLARAGHQGFLQRAGHPLERLLDDLEQDQRPWLAAMQQRARQLDAARAQAVRAEAGRQLAARVKPRGPHGGRSRTDPKLLQVMLQGSLTRGGLALMLETVLRQATMAGSEVPEAAREEGWRPTAEELRELLPQLDLAFCERMVGAG